MQQYLLIFIHSQIDRLRLCESCFCTPTRYLHSMYTNQHGRREIEHDMQWTTTAES